MRVLGLIGLAAACTEVQITAPSGELVIANSVESGDFTNGIDHSLSLYRRGETHGGGKVSGQECLSFALKYGLIGGMNEKGLSINSHALDLAVYQKPDPSLPTLCEKDVAHWVLGMHATVADVVAGLEKVRLVGNGGSQWGVADASGASVILEYVKGHLNVHNNTVGKENTGIGLMANDPTWDWHLQNLNNFAALQGTWYGAQNAPLRRAVPLEAAYPWATNAYDSDPPSVPNPIGHGYNLLGLPGDGSPPSRFIRTFFLRGYALQHSPPKDLNATLLLGQELLNSIYKVKGTIPGRNIEDPLETTPLSTLHVTSPGTKQMYYRSRQDMTWRMVDLNRLNFTASPAPQKSVVVARGGFSAEDVTSDLL